MQLRLDYLRVEPLLRNPRGAVGFWKLSAMRSLCLLGLLAQHAVFGGDPTFSTRIDRAAEEIEPRVIAWRRDVRMRQAVNFGINRERISTLTKLGPPARSILPPTLEGFDPTLQGWSMHRRRRAGWSGALGEAAKAALTSGMRANSRTGNESWA